MKYFRTSFKIILPIIIVSVVYVNTKTSRSFSYPPVYKNGVIDEHIVALAKIQHPDTTLPVANSLSSWNTYLQHNFLRPSDIDHQDMANMQQDPKHSQMEPLFDDLGMIRSINPSRTKYDHIFVFGGTPSHTNERFKALQQHINSKKININANLKVTYINGRRKIASSEVEEAKNLGVTCEYQHQCAELIWAAHYNGLPIKMEIMTIDPPNGRRVNTEDTLKAYYARIPSGKDLKILGYSNQPYVPYQADTAMAVAVKENRKNLEIEVVGDSSPTPVATITYLDSIARRVFTITTLANPH